MRSVWNHTPDTFNTSQDCIFSPDMYNWDNFSPEPVETLAPINKLVYQITQSEIESG